ncbi:MAG: protein NrnU [Ideonella sp. MAG2]|nr:MAG: protein NrnU [Ideonella sp. MAG2]
MQALILGLVLFLGIHSVRIFADDWRTARRAAMGEMAWKGLYSVVSVVGLVLIVWGYGQARQTPVLLWETPLWTRHLAALLTLLSFVLLAAAYVPRNALKLRLQHPMVLSVKVWALAHLLANNTLADVLLFGGFLVWAVLCFRAARRREPVSTAAAPSAAATSLTVAVGVAAWAVFAMWGHAALIGVRPLMAAAATS